MGGKRYFITFIDDYSRKTCVYFLKEKSKAFNVYKSLKVCVEIETGRAIKNHLIDHEGE